MIFSGKLIGEREPDLAVADDDDFHVIPPRFSKRRFFIFCARRRSYYTHIHSQCQQRVSRRPKIRRRQTACTGRERRSGRLLKTGTGWDSPQKTLAVRERMKMSRNLQACVPRISPRMASGGNGRIKARPCGRGEGFRRRYRDLSHIRELIRPLWIIFVPLYLA